MATSGSTNFSVNRDELIRSAFEKIGMALEGEALEAEDINVASRHLNMQIKAMQAHGLQIWKRKSQSITLVANQASYTLGPSGNVSMVRPLRILSCDRKNSSNTTTSLNKLSLSDYEDLPNKEQTGLPVNYFYDPTLTNGTLKVWLVPGTAEAAEYTLEVVYSAPIEDMDSSTDDFDFPQEWYEAIMLGLAYRLSSLYGLELNERQILRQDAREALDLALSFDIEYTSIYFQPDNVRY